MSRCDWAACDAEAFQQIEGWWMCRPHVREHHAMNAQPEPWRPPRPERPRKPRHLHPCGTRSAAARHRAKGEEVCDLCRAAEADYYRSRYMRRKQQTAAA